jgi:hypothetical protein
MRVIAGREGPSRRSRPERRQRGPRQELMDQDHIKPHDHDLWVSVAREAAGRVAERHRRMVGDNGLVGDVQYHWSMDDGTIVWSRGGQGFLRGRITLVGSVDAQEQTWLWSWANDSIPRAALGDIEAVRRFGEEHGFPLLVWPSFRSDHDPVYQSTMVALDVLAADGMWQDATDGIEMVFAVHDLRAS